MGFSYRIGHATVYLIVAGTCEVIWSAMQPIYLTEPTKEDWLGIAEGFERRWDFPNCIGALDGKHVVIQAPPRSGSLYFNYKGTFSMILMALVDHRYCFTVVDVGSYAYILPNAPQMGPMTHVIVGDEAFHLKTYLIRPYPGKNLPDEQSIFQYF